MKKTVALIGNPNVGKSTVFNALTGLNQHTGNWAGKTVACARGYFKFEGQGYTLVDLPGCYSLVAHSADEEIARDFIRNEKPDAVIVVCDAVCLERNMNLVLQVLEITPNVIVCVNLMDEAKKKNIEINTTLLSERLKIPVVGTSARSKRGLEELIRAVPVLPNEAAFKINYPESANEDEITQTLIKMAEKICIDVVVCKNKSYDKRDRMLDKIFSGKFTAFPMMFLTLLVVFWITIIGAEYPAEFLAKIFFSLEEPLLHFFSRLPSWLQEMLVFGVFRVPAWVIAVMLPPMAIFFPLFTLLEDFGYLPRVAFNLDKLYKKCSACGKQALTTMMGFGCNAAGVVGCRIIDSPRERLIATITNNFVPCNGRFPPPLIG